MFGFWGYFFVWLWCGFLAFDVMFMCLDGLGLDFLGEV